jgi:hypothetical protein
MLRTLPPPLLLSAHPYEVKFEKNAAATLHFCRRCVLRRISGRRGSLRGVIARYLVAGTHPGRQSPDDLMLFKSVGAAIEDLSAARLVIAASAPNRCIDAVLLR